jgi:glucose uptake protein GlcU
VFAIRDVGLAIAFPLWNTNSLVGILWGRVLFGELKGASKKNIAKVVLGALAIVAAAILLGFSTIHAEGPHAGRAIAGILAAGGASLLWGTMYIPYRKAYISGMNPLSFVTVFTLGELVTVLALVLALDGGTKAVVFHSPEIRHIVFWLFLGGFVWVIGDLFQQFATKYLGIGRGIPLSNTNQLWGLAWGALVFGELAHADVLHRTYVVVGSLVMIVGALAVSTAVATEREHVSTNQSLLRECDRYGLDYDHVLGAYTGTSTSAETQRPWWDYVIVAGAVGLFVWLGVNARVPALEMNFTWMAVLAGALVITAVVCTWGLWKVTRFS